MITNKLLQVILSHEKHASIQNLKIDMSFSNDEEIYYGMYILNINTNKYVFMKAHITINNLVKYMKDWIWFKDIDFKINHSRCHSPSRRVVEIELNILEVFRGKDETEYSALCLLCEKIMGRL